MVNFTDHGEIIVMESKNPLGPFTYKERILKNPGAYWGEGGNNHHCVFNFKGQWYITYHTRMLELAQGIRHGYRSTNVEAFEMGADGTYVREPGCCEAYDRTRRGCRRRQDQDPRKATVLEFDHSGEVSWIC